MTLEYDDLADVMHVTFSEPESWCTYTESSSGAILRVEEATGRIVGARILGFSRILAKVDAYSIPEMSDPGFQAEWQEHHRQSR